MISQGFEARLDQAEIRARHGAHVIGRLRIAAALGIADSGALVAGIFDGAGGAFRGHHDLLAHRVQPLPAL